MSDQPLHIVPTREYLGQLAEAISVAHQRIVIHAMVLLWDDTTAPMAKLIELSLGRGVEVWIVGDIYSKYFSDKTKRSAPENKESVWSHTSAINHRLESAGAHITYVGKLGLNPFKNRCHSKITIVDDGIYSFGGINFDAGSFENHDYMLYVQDHDLANRLQDIVKDITLGKVLDDTSGPIRPDTTLLFDGGKPGRSVIYKTACDIVANAEKVYYTSQMCPSGRLARLINRIDNECYFNRPSQTGFPSNLALKLDKSRYQINNRYTGDKYIHAKLILCEYADGSRHIVSSSNNYSWRGVAYGTKEIGIHSTNSELWDYFYEYIQTNIKGN